MGICILKHDATQILLEVDACSVTRVIKGAVLNITLVIFYLCFFIFIKVDLIYVKGQHPIQTVCFVSHDNAVKAWYHDQNFSVRMV
jgi:hypothetical protein